MKKFVFALVALLVLAGAGVGILTLKGHQEKQAKLAEEAAVKVLKEKAAQEYEDILNGFVQDIRVQMVEYKKQRRILRDISQAYNFETPEYAKQTYEEYVNQVAPSLLRQAIKVLGVFDLWGAKLEALLEEKPQETRDFILGKWNEMKNAEFPRYKTYFDNEEALLKAYEELFRFYYVKAKTYQITEGEFDFIDSNAKDTQLKLVEVINSLKAGKQFSEDDEEDTQKPVREEKSEAMPTLPPGVPENLVPIAPVPEAPPSSP